MSQGKGSIDSSVSDEGSVRKIKSIIYLKIIFMLAISSFYFEMFLLGEKQNQNLVPIPGRNEARRLITTSSIPKADDQAPKVAWLVSFPLSGSDYVVEVLHRISKKSTATNHGRLREDADGVKSYMAQKSIPLFVEHKDGPFLFSPHYELPRTYIPTTTYCTGHCWDCYPGRFVNISLETFSQGCVGTSKYDPSKYIFKRKISQKGTYPISLVQKAAVIIRNPIDVIEERFTYSTYTFAGEKEWIPRFAQNSYGFLNFCQEAEVKYKLDEVRVFSDKVFGSLKGIPCHLEFFKFIQWHNLLFELLEKLNLATHIVYYEDLASNTNFEETLMDMLFFFKWSRNIVNSTNHKPSLMNHGPINYFSKGNRIKIMELFPLIASNTTLQVFSRYMGKKL